MKLLAREGVELDLAVGSAGLSFIGFCMIFALGFFTGALFGDTRPGANVGACLSFVGIAGFLLHYGRSRILERRADRLDARRPLEDPLRRTFWTSSSDIDFVGLFLPGIVIAVLVNVR